MTDLNKEIDDIVAVPPKPPFNWQLVGFVSLATVVVFFLLAWGSGLILVRQPRGAAPPPSAASDPNDARIKGNPKSMIYHKPNCMSYASMSDASVEWFKTEKAAQDAGYRAAKNCS